MRTFATLLCCLWLAGGHAAAQTLPGRTAIEAVAAFASSSDGPDDPFVWLDFATTFRVNREFDVIVRPYARRLPGGDWEALLYQAQVRYQPGAGVRIDAGIITSPLGLGALELRPDINPTVGYPFYYFAPLPAFDESANRLQLLSGGYPLGAMVSWSGSRFDVRAGVTDGTPARYRKTFGDGPSSTPQFIAGGGFTPIVGLRVGAGIAHGKYRSEADEDYYSQPYWTEVTNADALILNVEAEYAFRYTRLSGEWVRDRFDTEGAPAIARGFYLQAVQTLTPRIFAAGRITNASPPVLTAGGPVRRTRFAVEATGGYRLTRELTLKAGIQSGRPFGRTDWNHAAVWSVVWAARYF